MSHIHIHREHHLGHAAARKVASIARSEGSRGEGRARTYRPRLSVVTVRLRRPPERRSWRSMGVSSRRGSKSAPISVDRPPSHQAPSLVHLGIACIACCS